MPRCRVSRCKTGHLDQKQMCQILQISKGLYRFLSSFYVFLPTTKSSTSFNFVERLVVRLAGQTRPLQIANALPIRKVPVLWRKRWVCTVCNKAPLVRYFDQVVGQNFPLIFSSATQFHKLNRSLQTKVLVDFALCTRRHSNLHVSICILGKIAQQVEKH